LRVRSILGWALGIGFMLGGCGGSDSVAPTPTADASDSSVCLPDSAPDRSSDAKVQADGTNYVWTMHF
jgi:hypothetical protein